MRNIIGSLCLVIAMCLLCAASTKEEHRQFSLDDMLSGRAEIVALFPQQSVGRCNVPVSAPPQACNCGNNKTANASCVYCKSSDGTACGNTPVCASCTCVCNPTACSPTMQFPCGQ